MNKRGKLAAVLLVAVLIVSVFTYLVASNPGPSPQPTPDARTAKVWLNVNTDGSGTTAPGDRWGSVETMDRAADGTLDYYDNDTVVLHQNPNTEAVILGGYVWIMSKGATNDSTSLRYNPEVKGGSWNISYEAYAPNGNVYASDNLSTPEKFALKAQLVTKDGAVLAAVELSYGTPGNNYVRIYDATTREWTTVAERIEPATTHKSAVQGDAQDRYIVSFQHLAGNVCQVRIINTGTGQVGERQVALPSGPGGPSQLVMNTTAVTSNFDGVPYQIPRTGAWIVDNLACRGGSAPYPLVGPMYEYAPTDDSNAPGNGTAGSPTPQAEVTISGLSARYVPERQRYEADVPIAPQWAGACGYRASVDNVTITGTFQLTFDSRTDHAYLPNWWNGWDWVSVFGMDDCTGMGDILNMYQGYDHPLTAYIETVSGSSSDVLATQSELAIHTPHTYENSNGDFWTKAVQDAKQGMAAMNAYGYASRWDNPAYVGKGHTFISMANPGNKASYEKMFALYQQGVRIDGRSSERSWGPAGNFTQYGSWYTPPYGYADPGSAFSPYQPMDLMDANRGLSWDYAANWSASFSVVNFVASNGGVLRCYGHESTSGGQINIPEIMHWIDDPKQNYTLENWKATDGEVASYLYGRWSTDIHFDRSRSSDSAWSFNVSRADPRAAGYWLVPVTVAVDLGGRSVQDIVVKEGGQTLRMSDGTLKDLHGQRVMDLGFDIRNGTLYVSRFWNSSATLTVTFGTGTNANLTELNAPTTLMMKDP